MPPKGRPLAWALTLSLLAPTLATAQAQAASDADLAQGRVHYIASCGRCHGMLGGGGEGPSLARPELPRAPDDATLVSIMRGGLPGTGMPGAFWLSARELRLVAAYVRSLAPHGPADADELRGDPTRGRALFEIGRCTECHTLNGFGTSRGPDLTTVGLRRGASFLRDAILEPGAALPRGQTEVQSGFVDYLMVRVVDNDGNELSGVRMNEDSYTIQVRDGRGNVHSYEKSDLREIEKQFDRSLMRSYRDTYTDDEVDDLVSYLATLRGTNVRGIS